MLKNFVLAFCLAFYTAPLLAHECCNHAGPNHNHSGFFCEGGALPDGETSFVLLPDGTHYVLDSKFWEATKELAALLIHDHDHGQEVAEPIEDGVRTPLQRLSAATLVRVRPIIRLMQNAQKKHFWVKLSANGVRLSRRYGVGTVPIILAGEILEHGLIFCPLPIGCATIYTAGIFSGKHMMRFWNMVRSQYPTNAGVITRLKFGLQQWKWNWQYWRAMRRIYHVSGENRRTLNEPAADSRWAAYFLAQERAAYLETQLQLADQAIAPLAEVQAPLFQTLNWHLTTLGQAIDRYSVFLAGRALTGQSIEDEPALITIDLRFETFFKKLHEFVDTVKESSQPITSSYSGQAIWDTARELKRDIRKLQVMGCEKWLEVAN